MFHVSPDTSLLLKRGMRRGVKTLLREREWGSTFGALVGIVALLQLLIIGGVTLQGVTNLLRSQTDLRLEIRAGATDQNVRTFFSAVKELPYVEDAIYITKEQAYETERTRDPELIAFLEEYKLENPFSDTIAVTLRALSDYESFAAFAKQEEWNTTVDPAFLSQATDQEAQVHEMLRLTSAGGSLVFVIVFIVMIILLFVLMELVRRRALARSEEILVERISGARTLSVVVPFATEAAVLLFFSLLFSTFFLILFLTLLPVLIPALQSDGAFGALRFEVISLFRGTLPIVILLQVILIPAISGLGAWLGVRPQTSLSKLTLATY